MNQQSKQQVHPMVVYRQAKKASNQAAIEEAQKMGVEAWNLERRRFQKSDYQLKVLAKKQVEQAERLRKEREKFQASFDAFMGMELTHELYSDLADEVSRGAAEPYVLQAFNAAIEAKAREADEEAAEDLEEEALLSEG